MKIIKKIKQFISPWLTLCGCYSLLLFLNACLDDRYDSTKIERVEENEVEISFTTYMSGNQQISSRALSSHDESFPSQIDLLVFKVDPNNGEETYFYHTHGANINAVETQENKKLYEFTSRLRFPESNEQHRLVILANLREEITAIDGNLIPGTPKEEILGEVLFKATEKWENQKQDYLPIWGESQPVTITKDLTAITGNISMIRAVAKVNVGLKLTEENGNVTAAGLDNFTIKQVAVRNAMDYGRAVPIAQNFTGDVAQVPSLPEHYTSRSQLYFQPDDSGNAVLGKIYLAESIINDNISLDEKVCVLIEGYYSEDPLQPNTTTTSWYRIDFYDTVAETNRDILRNYQYFVNITGVDGEGYDTEEKAYKSKAINIKTEILAWDEWDMGDITSDGQYQLVVNTDNFFFYNNGRGQALKIHTDYWDGWYIDPAEAPDWLQISLLSGNDPEESFEVTISATPISVPEIDREGYFYIRAGRMKKRIKVYQSIEADLYMEITPTSLVFRKSATSPKTVTITREPVGQPVYFSSAGPIKWLDNGGFPADGQSGTQFSFQPTVNTSGNLLTNSITIFITDDTGKTVTRNISVMQLPTDIKYEVEYQHDKYPSTGGNNLWMKVSAELAWHILANDINPTGILTPATYDLQSAGDDKFYYFSLTQNPTFTEREIHLYVTSPEPDFEPLTVTVTQDYTRPKLTVTTPTGSTPTLDFGILSQEQLTQKTASIQVNSDWEFSEVGNDYHNLIQTTDIPSGTPQAGGLPNEPENFDVVFTPKVYGPEPGTYTAGTVLKADVRFTTTNHLAAPEDSRQIALQGTVPAFFDHSTVKVKRETGDTQSLPTTEKLQRTLHSMYVEATSNVRWQARSTYGTNVTHNATTWGTHTETVRVPANNTWEEQDVTFYYTYDGVENPIATYMQESYHFDGIEFLTIADSLNGWGHACTFRANGSFPSNSIRLRYGFEPDTGTSSSNFAATETSSELTFNIARNGTGKARDIYFSYSIDGGNTWVDLLTVPQKKGNKILPTTGVMVAYTDYKVNQSIEWAEAMAIDDSYNTTLFGGVDADGNYVTTRQTGCADYEEEGYPKGSWRLPTADELQEIHYYRSTGVVILDIVNFYWSSTEKDASTAECIYYPQNQVYTPVSAAKSTARRARCVTKKVHEREY